MTNTLDDLLPPQSPSLSNPSPAPAPSSAASDLSAVDASHLDAIRIDEPAGVAGPVALDGGTPALFTKDQFHANFCGIFNLGAAMSHLQSLKVEAGDGSARAASDAIYDIATETPWLRFLIEPSNIWLQRTMAIGAFAVPRAMMVRAELQAKGRAAKPAAAPAGDAPKGADPMAGFPRDVKANAA